MVILSDDEINNIIHKTVQQELSIFSTAKKPLQNLEITTPIAEKTTPNLSTKGKTISIGTDHGGVDLKEIVKKELIEQGYDVIDCGTNSKDPVDYPDIAQAVSLFVSSGKAWRGIVIDGAGIGSCIAANKIRGIRAALCYDYATAVNSREHNDANVLSLGAGLIGINLAKQIVKTWLNTEFGGGRHAKRVNKIMAIEVSNSKEGMKK